MSRTTKIIYWIATTWLCLGMVSTAIVQLIQTEAELDKMAKLHYPAYLLPLLGVWKILAVIAILLPKLTLLKEWAYAGFFFAMSGAVFSHLAAGDSASTLFGPVLLLLLTSVSWYCRPPDRKIISVNFNS